jgi:DNA (cytosine-5)-methyltransferase 1
VQGPQANRPIKALDFFCGAGGLTRGLMDAGINVLAGVDNDGRLRQTYQKNNNPSRFICKDIRELDLNEVLAEVDHSPDAEDVFLYAACTPCQPFSTLNQRRGEDKRKSLLLEFGKLVVARRPHFVLVENVPGLSNAYGREVYTEFCDMLREADLAYMAGDRLDAQDYGVPQVRKRFIMLAARKPINLPRPLETPPATVKDAIGRFPAPGADLPNHVARTPKPHHVKILREVPHSGGSRKDIADTSILLTCHQNNPDVHKDVFGRMSWLEPSPTLTCRCTDVYCGRFAHPEDDRGLTLREAAALQSFRDDYVFYGTFFHIAQQIGNAVPVKLAEELGRTVVRAHREQS